MIQLYIATIIQSFAESGDTGYISSDSVNLILSYFCLNSTC
jgi:hypothetical protein